jgi:undecaprenyl-diphosphatase
VYQNKNSFGVFLFGTPEASQGANGCIKTKISLDFLLYNGIIMNEVVFNFFGENKYWDLASDILIGLVIGVFASFAVMGLVQWIKRKSLKKVDAELTTMIPSLILMAAIYVIFEKVVILGYRPILIDGVSEPSFPSTHVLIATTLIMMLIHALPKYVSSQKVRYFTDIVLILVLFAIAFGRVASGMHWVTDVLGGLVFGIDLALLYGIILNWVKERKNA